MIAGRRAWAMAQAAGIAAALPVVTVCHAQGVATSVLPIRVYSDYAATDPGTETFSALLARGGGLRTFGLPSFGDGVVTTQSDQWNVWTSGFGNGSSVRARDVGGGELKSDTEGFVAGADRRLGDNAIAGVAVGHANAGWHELGAPASGVADTTEVGSHGAWSWPDVVYGAVAVQYGFSDASVSRPGALGRFASGTVRAGGLVGHFIDLSGFTFSPSAELEYADTGGQTVQESGSGALTVDVPGQETLTGRLGVRINSAFFRWGVLGSPFVSLLWERRLESPDGGNVRPVAIEASDATVTFGTLVEIPGKFTIGLQLGGRFGNRVDEQLGRLSLTRGF